ncbi:hypothetical protein D3C73_821310 [compost metagenome]
MDRCQQYGELITSQTCHQIAFTQLRANAPGNGSQHDIACGMAVTVVNFLETVTVDKQHRQFFAGFNVPQRTAQTALKEGAIRQAGQAVVGGPVSQ